MTRPSYVKAPEQDASGDVVIKSLHICPTRGCRTINEKDYKFCDDCRPADVRKQITDEYDLRHSEAKVAK